MTPDGEHLLTAQAEPQSLDRVQDLLEDLWQQHDDVLPEDRIRFQIAVTEIAGNIVRHAPDGRTLEFQLRVSARRDRLEAEFRDRGKRVEVDLDAPHLPADLAESGRGLAMALAAVDELSCRREGPVNHWRIVRRRIGR